LYGTTFTKLPRATEREVASAGRPMRDIVRLRLEDFIAALDKGSTNERMRFASQVLERDGLGPGSAAGRERIRRRLIEARQRMLTEFEAYDRTLQSDLAKNPSADASAYATIFRDRGLSSDTSLLADYGVERALDAMKSQGKVAAGTIRHVAIVGPGLDFLNKADGYDFYPEQTIQPFAIVDSLVRLGLARADDIAVTTFDLSGRVNEHLGTASRRARDGTPYVVQLPLNRDERWSTGLLSYWERFGDRIGEPVKAAAPPPASGSVRVRAVRIRPAVVASIRPVDLNLVLERSRDTFDLIVATNILVYYDLFEQSLALANAAAMLRPGGILLANNAVFPVPPMQPTAGYLQVVWSDSRHDNLFWYERGR
jgi:SAM-dependent methyltransferase